MNCSRCGKSGHNARGCKDGAKPAALPTASSAKREHALALIEEMAAELRAELQLLERVIALLDGKGASA